MSMSAISMECAINEIPKYTLREQLAQRRERWLRDLAADPEITINPKLSRNELIEGIAEKLSAIETLKQFLLCFSRVEMEFFQEMVKTHEIKWDDLENSSYTISYLNGLITLYYYNEQFICVMPGEIRAAYGELERASFQAEWEHFELLRTYGRAAKELYGVIKVADIVDIFNTQNIKQTTAIELKKAISALQTESGGIAIKGGYLYENFSFPDMPLKDIINFAREAAKKPRYIPSKDEILLLGQARYVSQNPQKAAIEDFLIREIRLESIPTIDMTDGLGWLFQTKPWRFDDMTEIINTATERMNKEQAERFLYLIMDLSNNTRTWLNNGHTPNEIHGMGANGGSSSFVKPIMLDVGRNGQCPCGSGRKYKHCCGKSVKI